MLGICLQSGTRSVRTHIEKDSYLIAVNYFSFNIRPMSWMQYDFQKNTSYLIAISHQMISHVNIHRNRVTVSYWLIIPACAFVSNSPLLIGWRIYKENKSNTLQGRVCRSYLTPWRLSSNRRQLNATERAKTELLLQHQLAVPAKATIGNITYW